MSNKKKETVKPKTTTKPELFADTNVSMKSGHLVKDAELIADGKFVKIRIAANKQYMDANKEIKSLTSYFNALVSNKLNEAFDVAQNLKKGDWVYLKGEDRTQGFDTPEGYKKTETTLFAYKVVLKKEKQSETTAQPA